MDTSQSLDEILNLVRKLLKNQVFIGRFEERRLIDIGNVSMYKDIVIVDTSEREFMKTLKYVNDTLTSHFGENIITCIAGPQSNFGATCSYVIYTNLDGVTLGGHWFQVKNVSIYNDIFHITLKSLKRLKNDDSSSADINFSEFISKINGFKKWLVTILACLTLENIVTFSRFFAALLLTFFIGCYHLLELLLRGVQEVNVFVHNIVPVLIACVDGVTKIFGGFFILLAMMWNSRNRKNAPYNPPPQAYLRGNQVNSLFLDYQMGSKSQPLNLRFQRK